MTTAATLSEKTASGVPLPADLSEFERAQMHAIDAAAVAAGNRIKAEHPAPAELYRRAHEYERRGLGWLAGYNRDLADALSLDPRLAALPAMIAASRGDGGFGASFIPRYRTLLLSHLETQKVAA